MIDFIRSIVKPLWHMFAIAGIFAGIPAQQPGTSLSQPAQLSQIAQPASPGQPAQASQPALPTQLASQTTSLHSPALNHQFGIILMELATKVCPECGFPSAQGVAQTGLGGIWTGFGRGFGGVWAGFGRG